MSEQFLRTELLFGKQSTKKLEGFSVAIFGLGGVGGYAVEALARAGIGNLSLFDHDKICLSNLNRQILATQKTLGMLKVDAAEQRIMDINPAANVKKFALFYSPMTSNTVDLGAYDYIIDAIDTVSGKIELAVNANQKGIKIISCMGAGNKINPSAFEVADIYATSVCPLAKVMRHELKKRGLPHLKVVYSKEPAMNPFKNADDCPPNVYGDCPTGKHEKTSLQSSTATKIPDCPGKCDNCPSEEIKNRTFLNLTHPEHLAENPSCKRQTPGSNSFVPAVAGLILAGEVIKDLLGF